jgi:hypothetical protein
VQETPAAILELRRILRLQLDAVKQALWQASGSLPQLNKKPGIVPGFCHGERL